ncbi:MAG: hypothetical protein GON13_01030 [Nanoarchaeota archaeon]|nr:hypothetical protein [Nanoarchaeota archaeon]
MKNPELIVLFLIAVLGLIIFVNEKEVSVFKTGLPIITGSGELLDVSAVNITILLPDCDCFDAKSFVQKLVSAGLNTSSISELTASEGYSLIQKFSLQKLPAILFSNRIVDYPFYLGLSFYGDLENNVFVFRNPDPPYYSVESGEVVDGEVSVTYISHSDCDKCYNVSVHRDILVNIYGVNIGDEFFVNETSQLIEEYNISKIPTVILSKSANDYPSLLRVWPGMIAGDGSLVFTEPDSLGKVWYYDLELGGII